MEGRDAIIKVAEKWRIGMGNPSVQYRLLSRFFLEEHENSLETETK